jgi:transposase-like protein
MSTFFMSKHLKPNDRRVKWTRTFKVHVVRSIIEQELTYPEACLLFNGTSINSIRKWVKEFKGEIASTNAIETMTQFSPAVSADFNSTETILHLKKSLDKALLELTALNTLIDLAEKSYRIPIRKNSGTKQQDC